MLLQTAAFPLFWLNNSTYMQNLKKNQTHRNRKQIDGLPEVGNWKVGETGEGAQEYKLLFCNIYIQKITALYPI